jgi:acetyl esterase/lipase
LDALQRGYAVVSIDYRLSGEAAFPKQINDVKAAIRFVRAHAAQYDINPERLAVWGSSAGGNLAALAGTTAGVKELEDLTQGHPEQSSRVQAVVDWFGPVNFLAMDDQFKQSGIDGEKHNTSGSFESRLLGRNIAEVPDLVKAANPETYISPESPPFFIQHGTVDQNIPVQQSEGLAANLIAAIGEEKVTFIKLEGAKHGGAAFNSPENIRRVLDFLDKHMK